MGRELVGEELLERLLSKRLAKNLASFENSSTSGFRLANSGGKGLKLRRRAVSVAERSFAMARTSECNFLNPCSRSSFCSGVFLAQEESKRAVWGRGDSWK